MDIYLLEKLKYFFWNSNVLQIVAVERKLESINSNSRYINKIRNFDVEINSYASFRQPNLITNLHTFHQLKFDTSRLETLIWRLCFAATRYAVCTLSGKLLIGVHTK